MLDLADPRIDRFISKCMVVRVATLSASGLPHLWDHEPRLVFITSDKNDYVKF